MSENTNIKGIKIQYAPINDLTDQMTYPVWDGPSNFTLKPYPFIGNNSSLTAVCQIPSESVLLDSRPLLQSDLNITINLANCPAGVQCFQYGSTDALAAYPLQSNITVASLTLNSAQSSTNYSDVFPMVKILEDKGDIGRINSMCPSFINQNWGNYADMVLTNSNANGNYNECTYNNERQPNGSFPYSFYLVKHYINGVYADNSLISTSITDTWTVEMSFSKITEPFLCLSPFINSDYNSSGLIGINNVQIILNNDTECRRLWATGNCFVNQAGNGLDSYISYITLGNSQSSLGYTNTNILFAQMTLTNIQYSSISTKSVVGFTEYARYLTSSGNSPIFQPNQTSSVTTNNVQINQVPALICVNVAVPQQNKNWAYPDAFFKVNNITVSFNNTAGLLSSGDITQIFEICNKSGSTQSFRSFNGYCAVIQNGETKIVPGLGSLIVINPAIFLSLPELLSNSSIGQIQLQFTLNCTNQFNFVIQPAITILCLNSGFAITELGASAYYSAILDRQMVLQTKSSTEHHDIIDQELYTHQVGGKQYSFASLSKFYKKHTSGHNKTHKEEGGKKMSKSKLHKLLK